MREFGTYPDYICGEAEKRSDAKFDYVETARDIALDVYAD